MQTHEEHSYWLLLLVKVPCHHVVIISNTNTSLVLIRISMCCDAVNEPLHRAQTIKSHLRWISSGWNKWFRTNVCSEESLMSWDTRNRKHIEKSPRWRIKCKTVAGGSDCSCRPVFWLNSQLHHLKLFPSFEFHFAGKLMGFDLVSGSWTELLFFYGWRRAALLLSSTCRKLWWCDCRWVRRSRKGWWLWNVNEVQTLQDKQCSSWILQGGEKLDTPWLSIQGLCLESKDFTA